MAIKSVGRPASRNSWLNFCDPASVHRIKGSLRNTERTDYWELFIPPEIPSSENDVTHIVSGNERLDYIAYQYYGSSALWWIIAERNNISLPLSEVKQGVELVIPARPVVETILSGI